MKLYDFHGAPSPKRVRVFLAEKGIEIPTEEVNLREGAQNTPEFRAVNPSCTVPVLELDDGTRICEAIAICRYFEATTPEPPLMGIDARDAAVVAMWEHRCEQDGYMAVADALRNSAPRMKGRALPGPVGYEQIPALAERSKVRVGHFFEMLDRRLAMDAFVAGPRYSVADITALVAVEFAGRVDLAIPESCRHAQRWHREVSARPSAAA
jgi:glutathione S-transferase